MGYYSEVAISLYEKDFAKLRKEPTVCDLIQFASDAFVTGNVVTIYWDWVKWYDTYDDVKYVMDFLHGKHTDEPVPYVFRRVGESFDDIEEEEDAEAGEGTWSDFCDCSHIERYIALDCGHRMSMEDYLRDRGIGIDKPNNTDPEVQLDEAAFDALF